MRDALEQLLFRRYPGFYVGHHMPLTENLMGFGFRVPPGRRFASVVFREEADHEVTPRVYPVRG
ncbi:hypothetical protein [Belnapia rosea]|uniref:hypothetical protein n=1 Tax=Belnapia rosea TaxID=938405 RepID=UPI000883D669|nr:hypothetical protein [Belnapia rosea]SDB22478.1 hypothetical protein SAMN02927895_00898 [Belnapia rosea]